MSKSTTIAAIRNDIEHSGLCVIPFRVAEYLTGVTYTDDDTFKSAVLQMASGTNWITSCAFDWVDQRISLRGPFVEPGGP